jgi:excisionase family DNA binding protein
MSQKIFLSYDEAAELSGFSVGTLRNLVSQGILKRGIHYSKPHGRKVLIIREPFECWLKETPVLTKR